MLGLEKALQKDKQMDNANPSVALRLKIKLLYFLFCFELLCQWISTFISMGVYCIIHSVNVPRIWCCVVYCCCAGYQEVDKWTIQSRNAGKSSPVMRAAFFCLLSEPEPELQLEPCVLTTAVTSDSAVSGDDDVHWCLVYSQPPPTYQY